MELNFESLEIQKWNKPTYRAQRIDKNRVICLVIMFTLGVMVIKMLKMAPFFFCWWQQETVTVWAIYFSASERSHLALSFFWIVGFWASISRMSNLKFTGFWYFLLTQQFNDVSTLNISRTVTLIFSNFESLLILPLYYHFLKELKKIYQLHLNVLPKL